ncbi:MAG TPA: hypothetical protein VMV29_08365 [Ktedonobacterales bacterium]|nr:hypothetical protein [Ktedonobacterales bacterium]
MANMTKTQRDVLAALGAGAWAVSDGVGYQITDERDAGGFVTHRMMATLLCNHYIAPVGRGGGRYAITQEGRDALAGLVAPVPNGGVCQTCQRGNRSRLMNVGSDEFPHWQCGSCGNPQMMSRRGY